MPVRPRLRGVVHQYAFFLSLIPGVAVVLATPRGEARVAAAIFAATVSAMLGISALYHRVPWPPERRRWIRRVDRAAIYLLIAGTYTPYGLLVLSGATQLAVLTAVWGGVLVAVVLTFAWRDPPRRATALTCVGLGWVGIVALPQLVREIGVAGDALAAAGGLLYTAGAVVYTRQRPDPFPATFGFHEIFHVLVVAAVACQYASIAFFVLPR